MYVAYIHYLFMLLVTPSTTMALATICRIPSMYVAYIHYLFILLVTPSTTMALATICEEFNISTHRLVRI